MDMQKLMHMQAHRRSDDGFEKSGKFVWGGGGGGDLGHHMEEVVFVYAGMQVVWSVPHFRHS